MIPTKEKNRIYKNGVKRAIISSLALLLVFFQLFPKRQIVEFKVLDMNPIDIIIENVPRTEQLAKAPPPPRPSVPIPSEDPDIPEDLTISETEISFNELPPPPPPPPSDSDDDGYMFVAYDSPPEMIGGLAALNSYLKYPEIARRSGMEAFLIIGVLVDEKGNSVETQVVKSSGTDEKLGFEEEAISAVMKMKWKPAKQRDKPLKVWVSVPVNFKLLRSSD
jgi:protein TonB